MTFRQWFEDTMEEDTLQIARDIGRGGADAGWPGLCYTSECVALYEQHEAEIWEALADDAESMGYDNAIALREVVLINLVATFVRQDMLDDPDTFKNLLVWYMAERVAREISDEAEQAA